MLPSINQLGIGALSLPQLPPSPSGPNPTAPAQFGAMYDRLMTADGAPGGAGFAERGYERFDGWLSATKEAIDACTCAAGCPSCVQSPKCGNGNEPLDKVGASRLLGVVLAELAVSSPAR